MTSYKLLKLRAFINDVRRLSKKYSIARTDRLSGTLIFKRITNHQNKIEEMINDSIINKELNEFFESLENIHYYITNSD